MAFCAKLFIELWEDLEESVVLVQRERDTLLAVNTCGDQLGEIKVLPSSLASAHH
jgi:hypothetical protein